MNKKVMIGVGIGCATACLVLTIIVLLTGGAFVSWALEEPENVNINTTVPLSVIKGEPFIIEIRIENLAEQVQFLDSIDISPDYLAGIAIEESEPPFIGSSQIPFTDEQSYEFKQDIPAGETLVVQFSAIGLHLGDFAGEFDICINSETSCASSLTRTVVGE